MKPERRFVNLDECGVEVETREDGTSVIKGVAAVFYRKSNPGTEYQLWENFYERIADSAFDAVLAEGTDTRGLVNHDTSQLLGRTAADTMRLRKTKRGLEYEIDVPDTQSGRDAVTSLKRGDMSGSSFSFTVERAGQRVFEEGKKEVREITSVGRLFDVGPVTFPAYTATTAGVRAEDCEAAKEEYDRLQSERDSLEAAQAEEDKETEESKMRRRKAQAKLAGIT